MIFDLLEHFDSDYINTYLSNIFLDSDNIVKFLDGFVSQWIGSRIEYEVHGDYQKYLSNERISEAINEQRFTGKLFSQSEKVQNSCAAYILTTLGKADNDGRVAQASVNELLSSWREREDQYKILNSFTILIRKQI